MQTTSHLTSCSAPNKSFDLVPVTLEGIRVRLEPIDERHAESMARHGSLETFRFFVTAHPPEASRDGFAAYVRMVQARPATMGFAAVLKETDEAVGSSCYLDIRPADLHVEIGMTWIGEQFRRTFVNPEMKFLMLRHAFETLGCERVSLKTDMRNLQSQRAIEKLGAIRDGVLRKFSMMPDGYMRDTVYYGILKDEWPQVKEKLLARINL